MPATFLEPAAGGAFELFPRRQSQGLGQGQFLGLGQGSGDLIQASLARAAAPDPLMAGLASPAPEFRATAPLPPLPAPATPRLRRRA